MGSNNLLRNMCVGGTRRRLVFGIALIGSPTVLLLDEPTAGM